jgi:hypothetical protein
MGRGHVRGTFLPYIDKCVLPIYLPLPHTRHTPPACFDGKAMTSVPNKPVAFSELNRTLATDGKHVLQNDNLTRYVA